MSEDSGSDGTPGRKKRPKKALAVSETSDSEDAEDTVRIRKRLRVLSEDESTDSSGSSVPASRRGRRPPQLGDYEDEAAGDSSDWASDCGGEPDGRGGAAGAGPSGCASDSSEGNSDKCPICLLRFSNQEVGTPQSCEHIFCFDCITEWSKNVNTCPVDRSSFESIVVRTHAGGRVLRTVAVQVVQRRPSVELMVEEDPTNCEVCGRADSEESMLLCDGCDLGYHLQCLEPPLQEIPLGQWFCTNCSQRSEEDFVFISEVEDLLHDMRDIVRPNGRASRLRQLPEEPSTSSGRTIRNNTESGSSSRAPARRTATAAPKQRRRRKTKRRRTRTVIVEYEIKDGGKFPVKKKVPVKRRVKKRKIKKRQPRTAARRSLVRASVRERLASLRSLMTEVGNRDHVNTLASKRHGAGIPSLSLFGTRHQLEYFSDDEETEGGGGMVAVATRPSTSSLFSALRQARRKNMISNQSPPRASAGPDLLSSIMDSQTRLHSKKSLVSISVDGKVDIKLQVSSKERSINRKTKEINGVIIENPVKDNEKVNLTNGDDAAKKAPSYPGHSRGGGWNGGYRGGYNREGNSNSRDYSNNNSYNSGNYGTNGGYGRGSFQNSQGNFQNSSWQDEQQNFPERRFQDDNYFDRQRTSDNQFDRQNNQRPLLGRGRGYSRSFSDQGRQSLAPNWQPYEPDESNQRIAGTPSMARHSFGGFEEGMDALDMRVGQNNINEPVEAAMDLYGDIEAPRREDTPPQHYEPLPEPPVFRFEQPEGEKSEDERSDSGLVIDTEKYDPMEPTNDESSGDEGPSRRMFPNFPELPPRPPELSPIKVSAGVLNTAVQQVLKERNFFGNKSIVDYKSDDESDGDCPNFSIYSATSVNIANSSGIVPECSNKQEEYMENVEDLVQEDDDIPLPEEPSIQPISQPDFKKPEENISKEKTAQDEYEERLSRRCPITPNKRNPIKIKLNSTPTLIKRHVLDLYEDEEEEEEEDQDSNVPEKPIEKTPAKTDSTTHNDNLPNEKDQSPKKRTLSENYQSDDETSKKSDSEAVNEKTVDSEKTEEIKAKPISDDNNDDEKVKEIEKETKVHDDIFDTDIDDGKSSEQKRDPIPENTGDDLEKMTESISESEDERSYTPCLDENKSKDTSLENEKDISGIEGLDTEMISEDEGNEMFSEPDEKHISDHEGSVASLPKELTPGEDGEIVDKTIELEKPPEGEKKKKKKDKKVLKTKGKGKKSGEVAFKKLSKSGKERNYRDKEEKGKTKSKPKKSDDKENKEREKKDKKKEKRKDLERYDVRNIVSEKRRRVKDVFGRDLDSRPHSKSPSLPPSLSAGCRSISRPRRSISAPRRTLSRGRRSISRIQRSVSNRYTPSLGRSPLGRRSISRGRQLSLSPRKSLSPRMRKSTSPRGNSPRLRRSMDQPRAIPPRLGLSISPHHRSISPKRRSISPRRRTNSTRGRRSISLRIRRSVSQRPRRSISPRVRQSISPRERRSFSPRARRSFSPRTRRSNSPRINKPISPRFRRSLSHKRRKSVSPKRRKIRRSVSPKNRKSVSRSRKRVRRSISPKPRKSKSPRKKRRSRSKLRSVSRIRSRSPKPKKSRRTKARKSRSPKRKSPKPKKRKSRSVTPELMLSPERIRDRVPPVWRNDKAMYQAWSDTRSINSRLISPSWTPPREPSPDPRSLRVFLTNTEKPKRKEKKRRQREAERLRRIPDGPSKEVFTSGNNILVSVSFNKDDQSKQATELGKKRKRKGESKKDRRDKMKRRRGDKRQDTENNKPVAIIDLEKSPFRELTPSPKNIIVLSDSDHAEKEEELVERQQVLRSELHDVPTITQETNLPIHRELPFINSVGPKTPPEPTVKFSIMTKTTTQLRVVNPLHEEEELDQTEEAENQENDRLKEGTHKGPNTPPDPPNTPPSSPDAYDPFEPTKSGSATPEQETAQNGEEIVVVQEKNTITLETAQKTNLSADDVVNQRPITPIEKVMALLQSTRNVSPTNVTDDMGMDQPMESESASNAGPNTNGNQSPGTNSVVTNKSAPQSHFSVNVAPTVSSSAPIYLSTGIARIGAFSNAPSPRANSGIQLTLNQRIVLPSPTKSSPLKSQPTKLFLAKPSPIKSTPIKPMPSKTIISKLPLPNVKPIPGVRKKNNRSALNDIIDLDMDLDSPYSPGSSDFGDLFEPPSDGNIKSYSKSGKGDIFDSLFGGNKSKKSKSSAMKVPVKQIKKKGKTQVGVKMDEDNLKILDDLPSSAVEMQVKSKRQVNFQFLKKLNRQERVVEEVKHVLKPHYNKKHVTKEQYKDILRKAVPKICHNKHGEINPAKIQSLIEAYVRKFRKRNKS